MKLVFLVTAPDQLTAEMWKGLLSNNDIPAFLQPQDTSSFLGVSTRPCRLLVSEDRLKEALDVLRREEVT